MVLFSETRDSTSIITSSNTMICDEKVIIDNFSILLHYIIPVLLRFLHGID